MQIGAGRKELVYPNGFFPTEGFVSQAHPLYVRALWLFEAQPFLLVNIEMTSLPDDIVKELQEVAADAAEIAKENVWITVTHTFSAPHIMPEPALKTEHDRANRQILKALLTDTVKEVAKEASRSKGSGQIRLSQGQSQIPCSRDIHLDAGWWVGTGGPGQVDKTITVLEMASEKGMEAVVVHLNLQPSVLDGTGAENGKCVSGDVAGIACQKLEEKLGVPVLYMIGAAGDTAPIEKGKGFVPQDGQFVEVDLHAEALEIAEKLGNKLANEITEIIATEGRRISGNIQIDNASVIVPSKEMNRNLHELKPTEHCTWNLTGEDTQPISVLSIDDLAIVGVKPELTAGTDRMMKEESAAPVTLIATLVNGGAKYMAEKAEYDRYAYEAMNSPFGPGAAEELAQAALTMIENIYR